MVNPLPRPPRSPDARAPNDFDRWTRELRDYLDRSYFIIVTEAAAAQQLSPTLTALGSLPDTVGLLEQTAPDVFGIRAPLAAVADASGGATVDAEARTAVNAALARLRSHGLIL